MDREEAITQLEDQIESLNRKDDSLFLEAVKSMRKTLTLEELIKEQNYQPIRKDDFFKKTNDLGIEEPLEDLLDQID